MESDLLHTVADFITLLVSAIFAALLRGELRAAGFCPGRIFAAEAPSSRDKDLSRKLSRLVARQESETAVAAG